MGGGKGLHTAMGVISSPFIVVHCWLLWVTAVLPSLEAGLYPLPRSLTLHSVLPLCITYKLITKLPHRLTKPHYYYPGDYVHPRPGHTKDEPLAVRTALCGALNHIIFTGLRPRVLCRARPLYLSPRPDASRARQPESARRMPGRGVHSNQGGAGGQGMRKGRHNPDWVRKNREFGG